MKLLYVAGPFRGPTPYDVECNVREAEALGLMLAQLGVMPVIVHTSYRFFDKILPDQFWLEGTAAILMRCDALVLHPSWNRSPGSRGERDLAVANKIPVLDLALVLPTTARVDESFRGYCRAFVGQLNGEKAAPLVPLDFHP